MFVNVCVSFVDVQTNLNAFFKCNFVKSVEPLHRHFLPFSTDAEYKLLITVLTTLMHFLLACRFTINRTCIRGWAPVMDSQKHGRYVICVTAQQ